MLLTAAWPPCRQAASSHILNETARHQAWPATSTGRAQDLVCAKQVTLLLMPSACLASGQPSHCSCVLRLSFLAGGPSQWLEACHVALELAWHVNLDIETCLAGHYGSGSLLLYGAPYIAGYGTSSSLIIRSMGSGIPRSYSAGMPCMRAVQALARRLAKSRSSSAASQAYACGKRIPSPASLIPAFQPIPLYAQLHSMQASERTRLPEAASQHSRHAAPWARA